MEEEEEEEVANFLLLLLEKVLFLLFRGKKCEANTFFSTRISAAACALNNIPLFLSQTLGGVSVSSSTRIIFQIFFPGNAPSSKIERKIISTYFLGGNSVVVKNFASY